MSLTPPPRKDPNPDRYIQEDPEADKDFNADNLIKRTFNSDKPLRYSDGGSVRGSGCAQRGFKKVRVM